MRITYDPEADAMLIRFRDGTSGESEEVAPNVFVIFDESERPLGIEILFVSKLTGGDPFAVAVDLLAHGIMRMKPEPVARRRRVPEPG
jgi:uncharacterized protein YuzE